ncbi:hypothetical protein PQC11_gp157 [Synechococcus phage S-H9-1]|uniref:Uncharacterized protein n=1 Tax=Synechococcus phage S-H9-1 TaxID=2783674 RepID=A0A873WKJ2_9CAUD|nr:hypothetical protein PQC11_gp157 [Synechococcus phage S-H9-1]QPB08171.1 hypothetical protein [Synechococcus phage S-H9-1]
MSKKTPSQDFNYKFEHQWGGEDNWYTKGKRWANKQKFPINHLALGAIEWLRERWVDGRVEMEMASIDKQVKHIGEIWDKEDELNRQPTVEEGPSSVSDLPTLSIRNPVVERGTEEPSTSVASSSIENPFPDPWDGDWNDGVYIWERINKERSL